MVTGAHDSENRELGFGELEFCPLSERGQHNTKWLNMLLIMERVAIL